MYAAVTLLSCWALAKREHAPQRSSASIGRRTLGGLLLLLAAGALCAGQASATQRYTDKRLDVDLGFAEQGLVLRNRQNFRAYDCRVSINDKFFAVKVSIRGGRETLLPFGQFRTLNDVPYNPALEIRLVRVQCLGPTLRLRTYRRR